MREYIIEVLAHEYDSKYTTKLQLLSVTHPTDGTLRVICASPWNPNESMKESDCPSPLSSPLRVATTDEKESVSNGSASPANESSQTRGSASVAVDYSMADYSILIYEAKRALVRAWEDGKQHGYTDEWCTWLSGDDHLAHAYAHLSGARGSAGAERREHLQHALCRVAMALVRDDKPACATEDTLDGRGRE